MTVVQVADVTFGYGADRLFSGVTFSLALGERVALVAPNGAGKSTLLRLVARELAPDGGSVVVRRDASIAFARQSHELGAEGTVLDAFLVGFAEILEHRHALARAQEDAASGTAEALDLLARATDAYHLSGGDALERRVETIAGRLGFSQRDMDRPVASLSGGERGRLQLGVVLAQEADLLLLDEPTNHVDIDTIRWLESYLVAQRSAMIVVSHDRAFLDATCPATSELGRLRFRTYPLRYSDYSIAREEDLERERELAARQEAMVAKTEEFIRKNIAGQKTKQAQSRRKMLEKLETLERPEDVWAVAERVRFRFAPAPRTGDIVLEAAGLGAERGGRTLFEGLDLLVRRGDRVGIVGPNGSGKSTLLRLLAGVGESGDVGAIRRGTNLCDGYFDQHLGTLDPSRTGVEEVRSVRADMNVDATRQYLARFRFWGDDPLRRVSGFSGGERSRLALAKLLLEPRNLLFLDEPTNHLDIPAAEILEEALVGFDGTVILVSHDRRFLEVVTTRLVHLRDGRADVLPGGFGDFADKLSGAGDRRGEAEEADADAGESNGVEAEWPGKKRAVKRSAATSATPSVADSPEARRLAFEADKAAQRAVERKRRRVKELEEEIARREAEVEAMRRELKEHPGGDWAKLAERAKEEQALSRRIEEAMSEWMTLSEELAR